MWSTRGRKSPPIRGTVGTFTNVLDCTTQMDLIFPPAEGTIIPASVRRSGIGNLRNRSLCFSLNILSKPDDDTGTLRGESRRLMFSSNRRWHRHKFCLAFFQGGNDHVRILGIRPRKRLGTVAKGLLGETLRHSRHLGPLRPGVTISDSLRLLTPWGEGISRLGGASPYRLRREDQKNEDEGWRGLRLPSSILCNPFPLRGGQRSDRPAGQG